MKYLDSKEHQNPNLNADSYIVALSSADSCRNIYMLDTY